MSTSCAYTFPSSSSLCSFLNLSVAASSCNFFSLDSLRQLSLQMRFKTEVSCPLYALFLILHCTPPFSPSVRLICFYTPVFLLLLLLLLPPRSPLSFHNFDQPQTFSPLLLSSLFPLQTVPSVITTSTSSPLSVFIRHCEAGLEMFEWWGCVVRLQHCFKVGSHISQISKTVACVFLISVWLLFIFFGSSAFILHLFITFSGCQSNVCEHNKFVVI